ncbi:MAG: putative glycosyltransferase CsbB [candidate division WS2 bacterium ADurb.Bin280]|uniref:Putative glycosyltransferase CsbB n=1 Tax=candidate division WS2 bacterium ADurb.Bin280 TaxID=1852829 RepID=A0A1V5SD88_9BACT|nr:MAG: putative glycosyltransferase CsbB [candidate division WS2 bacterium ADurb.Bin280]
MPAFNEQESIALAIEKASSYLKKRYKNYEIIIVNDGSSDKTLDNARNCQKFEKNLKIIDHEKNLGYGAAVWKGLSLAQGELIFFTDSDLQFDINQLDEFIKFIDKNDAVIGYRKNRAEGTRRHLNALGWRIICFLLLGIKFKDIDCAFKLFKKQTISDLEIISQGAAFSAELLFKIKKKGCRILQKPVCHFKRTAGRPTGANFSVILKGFKEIYRFYKTEECLVKSRSVVIFSLAILSLFLSRILLLSSSADFFDSNQYIARTTESDFLKALTNGHAPFHPLYLFFSNLIYRLQIFSSPALSASLASALLGCSSIILFFAILRRLFGSTVAWMSSIIYAIFPYVYISQITILVDATMHFFFYLSLYFFVLFCESEKKLKQYLLIIFSGLALSLAALAHTQVAFWSVAFFAVALIKLPVLRKKTLRGIVLSVILFVFFALTSIAMYSLLLIYSESKGYIAMGINSFSAAVEFLLFGNVGDRSSISFVEYLKRFSTVSISLPLILSFASLLLIVFKKHYRQFVAFAIWLLPPLLTSSYIYENLHGRAMMMSLAPIAVLSSLLCLKLKRLGLFVYVVVVLQLILIVVPQVYAYHNLPSPNESLSEFQKKSDPGGVFSSSNVTRTWSSYDGEFINFGDVGVGAGEVYKKSRDAISRGASAYLSSDAIYHPFWRFDGQYFDIRSSGANGASDHPTLLFEVFTKMNVSIDRTSSIFKQAIYKLSFERSKGVVDDIAEISKTKNITFGRIVSDNLPVSNLAVNIYSNQLCRVVKEDASRLDLLKCFLRSLKYGKSVLNWTFTDKDGWFYIAEDEDPEELELVLGINQSETRIGNNYQGFVQKDEIIVKAEKFEQIDDIEILKNKIEQQKESFYIVTKNIGLKTVFYYYPIKVDVKLTNKIEAENLSSQMGSISESGSFSAGKQRFCNENALGYLVSGPYLNLGEGRYTANFRLAIKNIKDENNPAIIDVVGASGGLARAELKSKTNNGSYQDFKLEFELLDPVSQVELRVKSAGGAELAVDYIELIRN